MNRQLAVARVPIQSLHRSPDDIVLASMPLREGTDRNRLSRFGDDRWDMTPAIFQTRARYVSGILDFTGIDCPFESLTAKEYIHALLNERLSDGRARLYPGSARTTLHHLQRFMAFVRRRLGRFDTTRIDQDLIDSYRAALARESSAAPRQMPRYLTPIINLHRLAPWLTCGGLGFLPWGGRTLTRVVGCGSAGGENRTPRIPEPVIGALLHWSLKYLDLFSADILAARSELTSLQRQRAERTRRRTTDVLDRVGAWIDARRRSGRGIPVWEQPSKIGGSAPVLARATDMCGEVINMQLLTLQTDLNMQTIQENATALRLIREAVAELGIERGGMDTPITIDPDIGRPWRGRFDQLSLVEEEKHLQTAAYVLCTYLTGMRDGEVQAMRPGCVVRSLSADGMIERLAVRSTIYKNRGTRGEIAEWITIEPVDRAVAMAERLAAQHRRQRDDGLWLILDHRSTAAGRGIPDIVRQINRFRASIDERYGTACEPAIPHVAGRAWRFTPRQFRRTLAWYIANRPFGVVAGKIQYKHASVAMFDGYAGTSASGFRQEVEQERALGQLEDVVAQYEAHQRGERLAGPASSRLAAEYERVECELGPFPGRIADKGRLRAMLAHLARTLHVGQLNDCFFEPATALCLDKAGTGEREVPALSRCAPDRCPNACITVRHLPVWEASIAEADKLLRNKRLPRIQREALQRDNERKRRLIAPLKVGAAS
jgi:hypothetical protein